MEVLDTSEVEHAVAKYLPQGNLNGSQLLHVTVTWAQSLDGRISAGKGLRTQLSGLYSKKMTHYLRSKHDAILVGRGTLEADDPKLNCRYPGATNSPQPILLDTNFQWDPLGRKFALIENAAAGVGKAPWVLVGANADVKSGHAIDRIKAIESVGGKVLQVSTQNLEWSSIKNLLCEHNIRSLMVEGGAQVILSALKERLADAVIITIAPIFLGYKGVEVTTEARLELEDVQWWSTEAVPDSVVCGRVRNNR